MKTPFAVLCLALPLAAAELVVHNGKIATVDAKFSVHEAMLVREGRVVRLGTSAEILAEKKADTDVIDLGGKTVLPGLTDSHVHPGAAMTEFDHEIPVMDGIADVLAYVKARAEVLGAGEWIEVRQVFITRLREQRYPTRAELDAAAPNNPVVFATGPDASLNSPALERSGIRRGWKPGDGGPGKAEFGADGEPTGILRGCTRYVKSQEPSATKTPTDDDYERRTVALFRDYNAMGITSIADRNAAPDAIARYQRLDAGGKLTVRIALSAAVSNLGDIAGIEGKIRALGKHPLHGDGAMLRLVGIKTFLDGGMLTGSAYLREPWGVSRIYAIADPQYRGVLQIPRERLLAMVRAATDAGLQFTAHSVGDGAVDALLDVYGEVAREMPGKFRAVRPCITHCNFMSAEAVAEMARLGVVADIQPIWLHLDAHTLVAQFGQARLRWFQPLKSLFAAGVTVGGGSDHMQRIGARRGVNPYDPWQGMWIAQTRRARGLEAPLNVGEGLTREQAIRFYTGNNARVLLRERELGSLEPGKWADFIVLDMDVLDCPVDDLMRATVLKTFVAGALVFGRE
jgi:predicted amidohydrolase YtcJ